ncbi:hypothetical protein L6452_38731 [Arctium lappa]|uniref:Uncharacterized protein n=1 Tax=Arctium lappa TaxID=4217 RepID=A0ACB8XR88_ARCLA|nr:hypothetical protein L6452_38731 [Arctium lappa]
MKTKEVGLPHHRHHHLHLVAPSLIMNIKIFFIFLVLHLFFFFIKNLSECRRGRGLISNLLPLNMRGRFFRLNFSSNFLNIFLIKVFLPFFVIISEGEFSGLRSNFCSSQRPDFILQTIQEIFDDRNV